MSAHAQSFSSCLRTDLFFTQRLSSESHLTGGLCRLFSVAPGDASRVEILRRHGVCYDDLLVRADHPAVPRHRYGSQHVVALQRERLGTRSWVTWRQERYCGGSGVPELIYLSPSTCGCWLVVIALKHRQSPVLFCSAWWSSRGSPCWFLSHP